MAAATAADRRAQGRTALVAWSALAVAGTIAVWYLASYIDTLTALGRSDRAAAAALFRTRVLPVLWVVALLAAAAGAVLVRQGLRLLRRDTPGGTVTADTATSGNARLIGIGFTLTGGVLAAGPALVTALLTWLVR